MKNNDALEKDFLTIREFSEIVGMSASALRHYDDKNIFQPAKHGDGNMHKHRYYSPTQITAIKMIRVLTEIGVSLEEIKELAVKRTPERLMKLLSKHRDIVADELRYLNEAHSIINSFLALLTDGISATETDVYVTETPGMAMRLGDINDFSGTNNFYREFMRFCNSAHERKINLHYPVGGYFESMDSFLHEPSLPTRFFSIDPNGSDEKAEGLYLCGYTRGYYGQVNDLPRRLVAFAQKNGLIFSGPVFNVYLFDEMSVVDPEQYLLQVSVSVKETRRVPSRRQKLKI